MSAEKIIKFVLNESPEDDDLDLKGLTSADFPEPSVEDPYEIWWEKYKPIQNDVTNEGEDAPFNGTMFETYGPELQRVQNTNEKYVWTYVTGDDNQDIIVAGFHFVNRMGYFITENPWETGSEAFEFGEGDPNNSASAAAGFIDNELGREWIPEWENMPPQERLAKIAAYAEQFGLEDHANEIVAEVEKVIARIKASKRGEQI